MTKSLLLEAKSLPETFQGSAKEQLATLREVFKHHPDLQKWAIRLANFMMKPRHKTREQMRGMWSAFTKLGLYLIDHKLHRHTQEYVYLSNLLNSLPTTIEFHTRHSLDVLRRDWGDDFMDLVGFVQIMSRMSDHIHICGLLAQPDLTVFSSENIALVIEPLLADSGKPDLFLAARTEEGFWNFHADEFKNIRPSDNEYAACRQAVSKYEGQTIVGSVVDERAARFCRRCGLTVLNGLAYLGDPNSATYSQPLYQSKAYENRCQRYRKAKAPITHRPKARGFA